jgi:hypothetical protein
MIESALEALEASPPSRLGELMSSDCPRTTGLYTLWDGEVLLYVGIARVEAEEGKNPQRDGIRGRLNTYRRSRLTSDFAVQMFLRFVVPRLTEEQRVELARGSLGMAQMSALTRAELDRRITFRTYACDPLNAALIEDYVRREGLLLAGRPAFNPK